MKRKHLAKVEVTVPEMEYGPQLKDFEKNNTKYKLSFNADSLFKEDMKLFSGRVWITIETYFRDRSEAQNGVFHWYCSEIADHLAMEREDFKMMMKVKYLQKAKLDRNGEEIVDPETGEIMLYIPSTKDLDTYEMFIFTEQVRMWALDFLSYELPLPDRNYKLFKKEF